ncbi:MAG TPA: mannonate dehydratase [Candidatus Latescibacteria bacterium]|jgi:mannonate dehydratase|nr:mannonate dehydratase [Candidatus Latescibacterota bacterium]|tara:strand:+ start:448 stop:1407 length:960 start_codon:yes stop_codon:yes gene_type:complete
MIRISVWHGDMSDSYLRRVVQLGADCLDFGNGGFWPGVKEQGFPDLDQVRAIRRRVRDFGLDINRVTLPDMTDEFIKDGPGAQRELDNTCRALEVFAEAGLPIARQRMAGDTFPWLLTRYRAVHRGGYRSRGESMGMTKDPLPTPTQAELDHWWERFLTVYGKLVPIAEDKNIRLAMHPSDTPNVDTPFGALGYHRIIDAFPSRQVGYLYCCGTRAEAGGSALIMDEIHNYGRKGRLFTLHMRNVRGSLATAGAFEETLLDDGDINFFKVLQELQNVGFDGCINPDHIPQIEGDGEGVQHGLSYSIGYLRALLAALAAS